MSKHRLDGKPVDWTQISDLQYLNTHIIRCAPRDILEAHTENLPSAGSKAPKQPCVVLQIYILSFQLA
jgi:hypothetical protein